MLAQQGPHTYCHVINMVVSGVRPVMCQPRRNQELPQTALMAPQQAKMALSSHCHPLLRKAAILQVKINLWQRK